MKKIYQMYLFFFVTLAIGIFVFKSLFYGVKFVINDNVGEVIKTEDGELEASSYFSVRNGTFSEKEITFEMIPDKQYEREVLEEDRYTLVEISILFGTAIVSSDKKSMTIQPGEEVGLKINAVGTYKGDDYKGEVHIIRRAAPETKIVVVKKDNRQLFGNWEELINSIQIG